MAVALARRPAQRDRRKRTSRSCIGCGPVGLAVICHLKATRRGHRRRQRLLARDAGRWRGRVRRRRRRRPGASTRPTRRRAHQQGTCTTLPAALRTRRRARWRSCDKLPGWSHVYRVADALGAAGAQASGDLRMRRGAWHDRRDRRRRAVRCAGHCGRAVHGRRSTATGHGDQQGDRPALRIRLHTTGIPRHAVPAGRGQGGRFGARHGHRRASTVSTPRSPRSGIPNGTRRSSSIPPVRRSGCENSGCPRRSGYGAVKTTGTQPGPRMAGVSRHVAGLRRALACGPEFAAARW